MRMITAKQAAAHLGRSESWLRSHRPELEANGFPKPDKLIERYDLLAIDAWLDQRITDGYSVHETHTAMEAELRMSQKIAALSA